MELIIQEIAATISQRFEEELKRLFIEERDISVATKEMLDEIGIKLVAEALTKMDKAVRNSADRKRNWVIKNKADQKNLATIFGEVSYKRTYYQNKKTGEYCYLSDEIVGIKAHDKLDTSLKAKLIEEAVSTPYRRSGEKAAETIKLTSQTVMNTIRELGHVDNSAVAIKEKKKAVKVLYIEADEDHVALQDGRCEEAKLIYVHEGRTQVGRERWKLLNPRYFSGVYANSDELWLEVADYIEEAYDADAIEKIYLSGDGASWIKNGLSWIKGSIYVLDRYHLSKYVTQATAHMAPITPIMWKHINNGDKKKLKKLFSSNHQCHPNRDQEKIGQGSKEIHTWQLEWDKKPV
ncbi:MAG TPA: ISLre2 family transposase [Fervidobacterium sp.]|nr:ISLre2 family transposase [Fervidobacterium sp.]